MNAMPISDLLELPLGESQSILAEANIILAVDWRAKVDFVLYGSDVYYNSSGCHNNQTLVIFRIAIFGQPDLAAACGLIETTRGRCELDPAASRSIGRRANLSVCR